MLQSKISYSSLSATNTSWMSDLHGLFLVFVVLVDVLIPGASNQCRANNDVISSVVVHRLRYITVLSTCSAARRFADPGGGIKAWSL